MGILINEMTPTQRAIMENLDGFRKILQPYEESTKQEEMLVEDDQVEIIGPSYTSLIGKKPPKKSPDMAVTVYNREDWSQKAQQHIPICDPDYRPDKQATYDLLLGLQMNEPVMIYGPTGSGKTSLVEHVCGLTNRPFMRINGRGDMESGPMFGQPTVTIDPDTQRSVVTWVDGQLTEAARSGYVLLVDEPWVIPAEIMMALNACLEGGSFSLSDKSGSYEDKLVHPHKDFRMVYCDNTGGMGDMTGAHAGVNVQNTSTLDRFQTVIHLDYMTKRHEVKMLQAKVPDLPDALANGMVQFAQLVRNNYVQGDLPLTMSPRTLISWARKTLLLKSPQKALQMCFTRKFRDDGELQSLKSHFMTVFGEDL